MADTATVTARCKQCFYAGYMADVFTNQGKVYCNYIGITGERRKCPPGDDCNKFAERTKPTDKKALKIKRR